MDGAILAKGLVALVAIFGSLLVIKLLSPAAKAVEEEELSQTRQGEYYDGD